MTSTRNFRVSRNLFEKLTSDEKKALPLLTKAVQKIGQVYQLQENDSYKGANLYPYDAAKEEIEKAAEENPRILSPFTVVRRDNSRKLTAVDYHVEYANLLKDISKLIRESAKIIKNKSFKNYLESLTSSLVYGSYQQTDIAWLEIRNSNIDVIIGPHERYLDKLFFIKRVYQGNVGIIDQQETKNAKFIRDILYTTTGSRPHRVIPPAIVDIQVQQCLLFAGFLSRAVFTNQHLPSDSETTERYGSRILGYLSAIDLKFEKLIYPTFNSVFEKNFKASYSKDLLKKGNYFYALLIALAQQLHRYHNSRTRLRELFPVIDEANSVASGISHAKHLVLKGVMDQKELESMMIVAICWIFSEWVNFKKTNVREDYFRGDALTFNFLRNHGALQEKEGISWPNFAKMFFEMENLAVIFTRFLEEGTYLEVQEFLSKYLSFEPFKPFDRRLSKIKPL